MAASLSDTQDADESGGLSVKLPYQLGRFTLFRELGAGGMATVYLGRMRMTEGFDRLVAVKTIHGHLARAQTFVDMFLDEARIASQISHPNVCSVYDFGNIGGTYYLALEYLMGQPLIELVNRVAARKNDDLMAALPYLAARILADACEGLHAAHETRGADGRRLDIVHRDVSPQNLFVTYDGSVKVVDFGCAKAIQRVTQTDTGIMKGKVSYAAPEQLRVGQLDARVDVWALGVCLWECLTLQDLFRRESAIMSALAVMEEPIPRADAAAPWVPRRLAEIAEKALQRDPDQRYASAREMGRDLRAFIARAGVSFESAELAEWLSYLFADHQRQVRDLVAELEGVDQKGSAASARDDELGLADAATRLAKVASAPTAVPASSVWHEAAPAPERLTIPEAKPKRALRLDPVPDEPVVLPTRGRAWLWLTLLAVLLAGGGYAALHFTASDGEGSHAADTRASERRALARESGAVRDVVEEESEPPPSTPAPPIEPSVAEVARAPEPLAAAVAPAPPAVAERPISERPISERPVSERPISERRSERAPSAPEPRPSPRSEPRMAPGPPPTAERERTTTTDTSQGQVMITTEGGWAQVFLGDRSLGRTPLRVSLPVGRQTLRLLPYGREPAQHAVVPVEWGAVNRITLRVGPPPRAAGEDEPATDPAPPPAEGG